MIEITAIDKYSLRVDGLSEMQAWLLVGADAWISCRNWDNDRNRPGIECKGKITYEVTDMTRFPVTFYFYGGSSGCIPQEFLPGDIESIKQMLAEMHLTVAGHENPIEKGPTRFDQIAERI